MGVPALPGGKVGLAIKLAVGLLVAVFWTSGPGADEARLVVRCWRTLLSMRARVRALGGGLRARAVTPLGRRRRRALFRRLRLKLHKHKPTNNTKNNNSDVKASVQKRNQYSRHYAFKGRGRKESLRGDNKLTRTELVPGRA